MQFPTPCRITGQRQPLALAPALSWAPAAKFLLFPLQGWEDNGFLSLLVPEGVGLTSLAGLSNPSHVPFIIKLF